MLGVDRTHFQVRLIDSTTTEDESVERYMKKLGLTLGRAILRPDLETPQSIQDQHPTRSYAVNITLRSF